MHRVGLTSYHILHLLGHDLRVRIDQSRFAIENRADGSIRHVPVEDVALVIAAAPDLVLTGAALVSMAERRVPLLICGGDFRPIGLYAPLHGTTSPETLRGQLAWTEEWKTRAWRRVIGAKIRNQALNLPERHPTRERLLALAEHRLESGFSTAESNAARWYWRAFFPLLRSPGERRVARTRDGLNGLLDYGYAVVRTAVMRSLAGHGFLTTVGLSHSIKPGAHPLADDLMEPLRPFVDRALHDHVAAGADPDDFKAWIKTAASVLTARVRWDRYSIRLLYGIDRMVQSLGEATTCRDVEKLRFPTLDPPPEDPESEL